MANTITTSHDNDFVELTSIDSDYDAGTLNLFKITLVPDEVTDKVVFKFGSDTGPEICRLESVYGEPIHERFNGYPIYLYMDYSDCSISTNTKVIIHKG